MQGKYITFKLSNQIYAVGIQKIREIIGMTDITSVPQTPAFVKGVINLRGKVMAVVCLRSKFGYDTVPYDNETCMIVVDMENRPIAVIVDAVYDVVEIKSQNLENALSFGINIKSQFIEGISKINDDVIILLYMDKILNSEELVLASDVAASASFEKSEA